MLKKKYFMLMFVRCVMFVSYDNLPWQLLLKFVKESDQYVKKKELHVHFLQRCNFAGLVVVLVSLTSPRRIDMMRPHARVTIWVTQDRTVSCAFPPCLWKKHLNHW